MKQLIYLVIGITIFTSSLFGQTFNYPKGAYLSIDEILKKSPSKSVDLEIERRTKGDIKMNGGNDYKLYKADKSISKKTIKREYFAYSSGDTLYLNCLHYKVQPWYAPVLSDGKFFVIVAGLSMEPKTQKEQLNNQAQYGYMFGAFGGAMQGAKLAMLRFVYVIDKETNKITTVSSDFLTELLASNLELLAKFQAEKEQKSHEVFIKYLKQINEE